MFTKITLDSGYSTEGEITLKFNQYVGNRRTCLRIVDGDGEVFMTVTTNLPEDRLPEGWVYIKDYSENRGIFRELTRIGIIKRYERHHTIPDIYLVKLFPFNLDNFNGKIEKNY